MPKWRPEPNAPMPAEELVSAAAMAVPAPPGMPSPVAAAPSPVVPVPVPVPVPAPAGGQRFGAAPAMSAPVGPPGVRAPYGVMPAMQPPGTFTPVHAPRPRKARKRLTMLLVLATLGGAAYLAYAHVRAATVVPVHLSSYVGGKGVVYEPAGGGFAVRLPASPKVKSWSPGPGLPRLTEATSSGLGFAVRVRSSAFTADPALPRATLDAGVVLAGSRSTTRATTLLGHAAVTGTSTLHGRTGRYLSVLVGRKLFVFAAESTRQADDLFAALTKSFHLT